MVCVLTGWYLWFLITHPSFYTQDDMQFDTNHLLELYFGKYDGQLYGIEFS